ncbi:MAG: hypothetical protein KKA73_07105 [Chloroflexi bacterium]|nr:hypothetical protein [Chloroflexota bacterium]MBU1747438.1 hypothetical protein [Chloroflexota bacterium]
MNEQIRMRMLREVALRADGFYPTAERLGHKAAKELTERKRAQITGLESIANSALKTSDVFDFIKIRTARQKEWQNGHWGSELLKFLSQDLRRHREQICAVLQVEPQSAEGLEVHLLLIREFVRQLAAHYEYDCQFPGSGGTR